MHCSTPSFKLPPLALAFCWRLPEVESSWRRGSRSSVCRRKPTPPRVSFTCMKVLVLFPLLRSQAANSNTPTAFGARQFYWNIVYIRPGVAYGRSGCLDNQPLPRHGRSSIEFIFSDDLKPDRREQSGKERSV